jgi:hypothetical protein
VTFGPFATDLDPAERLARIRSMRALASVFAHRHQSFVDTLRAAEVDPAAFGEACRLLDTLPALNRRRLLASYADLTRRESAFSEREAVPLNWEEVKSAARSVVCRPTDGPVKRRAPQGNDFPDDEIGF